MNEHYLKQKLKNTGLMSFDNDERVSLLTKQNFKTILIDMRFCLHISLKYING